MSTASQILADYPRNLDAMQAAVSAKARIENQDRYVFPDGSIIWVYANDLHAFSDLESLVNFKKEI